jgi:hypothetical protein
MNSVASHSAAEPLIFNWDSPRGEKLAITIFLAISVVGHALCFYIFQIVYPPTVALLPPPARVALITPTSEEGRTLLRWIEAEDPALAFTTLRPKETKLRALPKAEHVPSYSEIEPSLKNIPPLERDLGIPSCQPPGSVQFLHKKTAPPVSVVKTSVSFSNELQVFGAPILPEPAFVASNEEMPETIRFRVAVSRLGEVRYCFPINSSGDPALDEQARLCIARCRFPQNTANAREPDSFLTWGTATIVWGNDIARSRHEQRPLVRDSR